MALRLILLTIIKRAQADANEKTFKNGEIALVKATKSV